MLDCKGNAKTACHRLAREEANRINLADAQPNPCKLYIHDGVIESVHYTTPTTEMASGRAAPAIEVRELVKIYGGKVRALDGLNFTVEAGAIFALLGPNGAGKSTTIKILNTLSRPDFGSAP